MPKQASLSGPGNVLSTWYVLALILITYDIFLALHSEPQTRGGLSEFQGGER